MGDVQQTEERAGLVAPKYLFFLLAFIPGVLVDQATKLWTIANIELHFGEWRWIDGWLSWVYAQNPGAAFSSFEGAQTMFLVFTVIATLIVIAVLLFLDRADRFTGFVLGMMWSGAIGNFIDRLRYGYVIDFIKVYTENEALEPWLLETFHTNIWPIFNVADSLLVVGVIIFLVRFFFLPDTEPDDSLIDEL